MKNFNSKAFGLLGLFAALAFNSSHWWNGQSDMGSANSASKGGQSIEQCIKKNENIPRIGEMYLNCTDEDLGIEFKANVLQITEYVNSKTGEALTEDEYEYWSKNGNLNQNGGVWEKKTHNEAEITAATLTNEDCDGSCFEFIEVARTKEGSEFKFSRNKDQLNDSLAGKARSILKAIESQKKKHVAQQKEQEEKERKEKLCIGKEYEEEEALESCIDTQLSSLKGKDLKNFLNKRVVPHFINLMANGGGDPTKANELMEKLSGLNYSGQSGLYINGTLRTMGLLSGYNFDKNIALERSMYEPGFDFWDELQNINSFYTGQIRNSLMRDPLMGREMGSQINHTLRYINQGYVPSDIYSGTSYNLAVDNGRMGGNPYVFDYTDNMARKFSSAYNPTNYDYRSALSDLGYSRSPYAGSDNRTDNTTRSYYRRGTNNKLDTPTRRSSSAPSSGNPRQARR